MSQHDVEFTKLSGSGNDFICIDSRDGRYADLLADPERLGEFARMLCRRGLGVGADGVIFAAPSEVGDYAHVAARFLEADGSEAELCGNGTACFTWWMIHVNGSQQEELKVLTSAGVVRGRDVDEDYVRVCIPLTEGIQRDLQVEVDDGRWRCDLAVTGVPHLVTWVEDVERVDVQHHGSALRWHKQFQPRGVNANFVQVLGEGRLAVRTFEFGVEGETLACGTGSATASVLAVLREPWAEAFRTGQKPVLVRVRGGDDLRVWVTLDASDRIEDLCLDSVVRPICIGRLCEHLSARALGCVKAT